MLICFWRSWRITHLIQLIQLYIAIKSTYQTLGRLNTLHSLVVLRGWLHRIQEHCPLPALYCLPEERLLGGVGCSTQVFLKPLLWTSGARVHYCFLRINAYRPDRVLKVGHLLEIFLLELSWISKHFEQAKICIVLTRMRATIYFWQLSSMHTFIELCLVIICYCWR